MNMNGLTMDEEAPPPPRQQLSFPVLPASDIEQVAAVSTDAANRAPRSVDLPIDMTDDRPSSASLTQLQAPNHN